MKKVYLLFLSILSLFLIQNVYAETYDGEYSIEYLLKNYNVVTLGEKATYEGNGTDNYGNTYRQGDLYYNEGYSNATINGAVLVSGNVNKANYDSNDTSTLIVSSNSETIKSYIKGTIGSRVEVSNHITDSNYLDFNKMYEEVMKESQAIADKTQYYINNKNL